jgi:hypothetical protein
MAQPAIKRFEWELEVCLTNLKSLGVKNIILLFSQYDDEIPKRLSKKYNIECYVYSDNRDDKSYIPSIKPYLWWQFLKENPNMQNETYFYMDSDVIFREIPDFSKIEYNENLWVGSDTDSYLSPKYINSKGEDLLKKMADIIGVDYDKVAKLDGRSAGAQWIITKPTIDYWEKAYKDCNKLYTFFGSVEKEYIDKNNKDYVPIQKWTSQMWADLWNILYFNKDVTISHELDFSWATDDIHRWDETKIYHNAGVVDDKGDLFFKGKYVDKNPFDDDLSFINKNKCSYKYGEAIKNINDKLNYNINKEDDFK